MTTSDRIAGMRILDVLFEQRYGLQSGPMNATDIAQETGLDEVDIEQLCGGVLVADSLIESHGATEWSITAKGKKVALDYRENSRRQQSRLRLTHISSNLNVLTLALVWVGEVQAIAQTTTWVNPSDFRTWAIFLLAIGVPGILIILFRPELFSLE